MTDNGSLDLCGSWQLQHASLVDDPDEVVSAPGYAADGWHVADVPTTILNALVRDGTYPDPRYGMNAFRIPDASDDFNAEYDLARFSHLPDKRNPWRDPWWYRREFMAPASCGTRQRLVFDAINYRAEIRLNGRLLAGGDEIVGAFRRFAVDVTGVLRPGERNVLAVRVYLPDHRGVPQAQLVPFQSPRAHVPGLEDDLMKDVCINLAAVGYDCAPTVPDRLSGLWQAVRLEWGGPVRVVDPFVRTRLPLPSLDSADLTVSAELSNESDGDVEGVFRIRIGSIGAERAVTVPAGRTVTVSLGPAEFPQLTVPDPRLWWPSGYGPQHLHTLEARFVLPDSSVSSSRTVRFGIREVTKVLHEVDGEHGLRVTVNGRRVFCRGGYLQADALLCKDMLGEKRLDAEFRYLAEAGINTVCYEDLPNPPDILPELCDRYGIMIWQCFFQCHWLTTDDHPLDHDLLEACAADIVRRYRNHPSIVAYMCMNEGATNRSQYLRWRRQVTELDGTRILVPSGYPEYESATNWPEWILPDAPVGANDCQPKTYGWQDPAWYFRMVRDDRTWMFKIESGSASLPALESLDRFLVDEPPAEPGTELYPLNAEWAHHGANSYYRPCHEALVRRHGPFSTPEAYCRASDLQSVDQHRAMFEAVNHRMWDLTSGFLQWKLNSCWPSIQWQIYDYFLRPTASYYAIKRASAPVSVLLSPLDRVVSVVNNGDRDIEGATLHVRVLDLHSVVRREIRATVNAGADRATEVVQVPPVPGITPVFFVRIDLIDRAGAVVARNFYWLPDIAEGGDDTGSLIPLSQLPPARIRATIDRVEAAAVGVRLTGTLRNVSETVAVCVRTGVAAEDGTGDVQPAYWRDNCVSLLPGEERLVFADLPWESADSVYSLSVDGWNVVRDPA